jgi:imidazolonepropionase-like amidohydrolase
MQRLASLVGAQSSRIMRGMLQRGFTSVRDAGGANFGLQEAVARGLCEWPRLFIAGFPISQTGGHADLRPRGVRASMFCACAGLGLVGAIANIDGLTLTRQCVAKRMIASGWSSRAATSPARHCRTSGCSSTPPGRWSSRPRGETARRTW